MGIFYLMILLLLFIIMLLFTAVFRIVFFMDTEREDIRLTLLWLYPFLKVTVESKSSGPTISIHFFKRKIYRKALRLKRAGSRHGMDLARAVRARHLKLNVKYGFSSPFATGIVCGTIGAAADLAGQADIRQEPDFIADRDYILVNATADVNVGHSIINFARLKKEKNKS